MKNNISKIVIVLIIIVLIVAGVLIYRNMQEEKQMYGVEEKIENIANNEIIIDNENVINTVNSAITNEVDINQNSDANEVPGDMEEYYISIGKWKKFEFNTPVGEDGKYGIYAEKAVQARGFSGASAHIYYLREGEVFYHNQDGADTKLASGITDLRIQGEDIIAVKGEDAKIYVENQYIQYK